VENINSFYVLKMAEHLVITMFQRVNRKLNKKNSSPCNRTGMRIGLRDIEAPTFCLDNRLTDGGEVSALCSGRPLSREFLALISVRG
jgi:hypothetical protein